MKNSIFKKISEIRGQVLGLEMALSILEDDLDFVLEKLYFLNKLEADLEYNIKFLKNPKIVSVVGEYHKSIEELKMVKQEITKHKNIKIKLEKDMEIKLKNYQHYIDELEATYKDMEKEKVILLFKRKDDG